MAGTSLTTQRANKPTTINNYVIDLLFRAITLHQDAVFSIYIAPYSLSKHQTSGLTHTYKRTQVVTMLMLLSVVALQTDKQTAVTVVCDTLVHKHLSECIVLYSCMYVDVNTI